MTSLDAHPFKADEAEATVHAIHFGAVDAVVVQGPEGPEIVMLQGGADPYRALVERMSDGALTLDDDGTILYANNRLGLLTGDAPDLLIGRDFGSLFHDDPPRDGDSRIFERQLRTKADPLPVSIWMNPISIGGISAKLVTITDLSTQRRAEEIAIAERFARSILEQATDAIVVLTPDGHISHASWMAEQIAGKSPVGLTFSEAFPLHASSCNQVGILARLSRESLEVALATKPFHGVEVRLSGERFARRSFLLSAGPLLNDDKYSVGSIVTLTEITERKRSEEQQAMLVAELNHRVKNILAVVQAVAWQTLRKSSSLDSFGAAFSGRLKAISVAHDILTRTRWIGIGLNELLAAVLAPYRSKDETRIALNGPPILLPARAVTPLSMALHELATNASKYGALSQPYGNITVEWEVSDGDPKRVTLVWRERGGPKVARAATSGFGTMLIKRLLTYDLEGGAELSFEVEGIRAALSFALKPDTPGVNVPAPAPELHEF